MDNFVWNKEQQAYFQKDNMNGWCVIVGYNPNGTYPEYQVSDSVERSESYDFLSHNKALKECIRLNKEEPLEEKAND